MKWLPLFLALCSSATAAELVWDRNSETNVLGYRVYWSAQSRYSPIPLYYDNIFDVGNATNFVLSPGAGRVFYAVTAYDTELLESEYSDEVFYDWPIIAVPPSRPMNLRITETNNVAQIRLQQRDALSNTPTWRETGIAFVPMTNQMAFFRAVAPSPASAAPKLAVGSKVGALERMKLLP